MEPLNITEIAKAVQGNLVKCSEDIVIKGVTASLISIRKGYIYIPLKDNCLDPSAVSLEAVKKGAVALIVTKEVDVNIPQVIVEKPKEAYRSIAKYYRKRFNIPLIAVTGSYGKTSTKDMISYVLEEKFDVHKTKRNFNGLIGMPATILQLNSSNEVSVVEMGMEAYGHIKMMTDIATPSIAVITNIGTAHIGNFGKKEYIMKAKLEVTSNFDKNDILIINNDDKLLETLKDVPYKIIKIAINNEADFKASEILNLAEKGVEFKCSYGGKEFVFKLKAPGVHNIYNALFAIAIGELFGLNAEEIKRGLLKFTPEELRMNVITLKNGIKLIVDCYTAEPDTVEAAIDVLNSFKGNRKIAVLGGMFGQGSNTEKSHRRIGKYIIDKCNLSITIGKAAKYIYEEAKNHIECKHFDTKEEASQYLEDNVRNEDIILVNGGRMAELETLSNHLIDKWNK